MLTGLYIFLSVQCLKSSVPSDCVITCVRLRPIHVSVFTAESQLPVQVSFTNLVVSSLLLFRHHPAIPILPCFSQRAAEVYLRPAVLYRMHLLCGFLSLICPPRLQPYLMLYAQLVAFDDFRLLVGLILLSLLFATWSFFGLFFNSVSLPRFLCFPC